MTVVTSGLIRMRRKKGEGLPGLALYASVSFLSYLRIYQLGHNRSHKRKHNGIKPRGKSKAKFKERRGQTPVM